MSRFIKASDLTPRQLSEGQRVGTLQAWRVDANGEQWYQHGFPDIHGVPTDSHSEAEATTTKQVGE